MPWTVPLLSNSMIITLSFNLISVNLTPLRAQVLKSRLVISIGLDLKKSIWNCLHLTPIRSNSGRFMKKCKRILSNQLQSICPFPKWKRSSLLCQSISRKFSQIRHVVLWTMWAYQKMKSFCLRLMNRMCFYGAYKGKTIPIW